MSVPEVMNRATIAGAIEIGRAPGVVQVTFRAPAAALETAGLQPLRRGAVCLNETGSPREPRAGSTSRRPTSTPPTPSTASCSAGRRRRPARSRRPAATGSSSRAGKKVAGVSPLMSEGQPVVWSTYFATDDVDALAERVTEFGGTSFFEPMDVMDAGRMGFFAHPAGGAFGGLAGGQPQGRRARQRAGLARLEHADHAAPEDAAAFFGLIFGLGTETQRFGGERLRDLHARRARRRRPDGPAARDARGRARRSGASRSPSRTPTRPPRSRSSAAARCCWSRWTARRRADRHRHRPVGRVLQRRRPGRLRGSRIPVL